MGKIRASTYDKRKILQAFAAHKISKEEARYLLSTTIAERTIFNDDKTNASLIELCEKTGIWIIEIHR